MVDSDKVVQTWQRDFVKVKAPKFAEIRVRFFRIGDPTVSVLLEREVDRSDCLYAVSGALYGGRFVSGQTINPLVQLTANEEVYRRWVHQNDTVLYQKKGKRK